MTWKLVVTRVHIWENISWWIADDIHLQNLTIFHKVDSNCVFGKGICWEDYSAQNLAIAPNFLPLSKLPKKWKKKSSTRLKMGFRMYFTLNICKICLQLQVFCGQICTNLAFKNIQNRILQVIKGEQKSHVLTFSAILVKPAKKMWY